VGFKGRFAAEKQENSELGPWPQMISGIISKEKKTARLNAIRS
jgi:hypothetical protein